MKRHLWIGLLLGLTACASIRSGSDPMSAAKSVPASLSDYGQAPEFTNEIWLNVDTSLRPDELRGKVIAIDMWTFG